MSAAVTLSGADRPVSVLIAALGGEGGGVLAKWIVDAAEVEGLIAQSTSVPGVAQRTGATTYYVEIARKSHAAEPVLALTPTPGEVDVMIVSELLEVARVVRSGFVTSDRTTLIGSTHRTYSFLEKQVPTDGRYDSREIVKAAKAAAKRALLTDIQAQAKQSGSVTNAVMLGIVAGSQALPMKAESFRSAIELGGKAVESNERGFALGYDLAQNAIKGGIADGSGEQKASQLRRRTDLPTTFPTAITGVVSAGLDHLEGYQDRRYVRTYLERVGRVLAVDGSVKDHVLTVEAARYLALWMAYEDIIRVADLKTQFARHGRIAAEAGARPGDLVHVTEFLRPGMREVTDILPSWLGRALMAFAPKGPNREVKSGMKLRTTTVSGFFLLRSLVWLKPLRRISARFHVEQRSIEQWLDMVVELASSNPELAMEWVECARLLRGYGDTHDRGLTNFEALRAALPQISKKEDSVAQLRAMRVAALNDPSGRALAVMI